MTSEITQLFAWKDELAESPLEAGISGWRVTALKQLIKHADDTVEYDDALVKAVAALTGRDGRTFTEADANALFITLTPAAL